MLNKIAASNVRRSRVPGDDFRLKRPFRKPQSEARVISTNAARRNGQAGRFVSGGPTGGVVSEAAVVVTLTRTAWGRDPSSVMEDGVAVQVASKGAPAQVKATVLLNPPTGVTLSE